MSEMYGAQPPHWDARLQGAIEGTATADSVSTHDFIFDFDCYFNGIEIYSWDSTKFDNIVLETQYNIGTVESPVWRLYKRFSRSWYIYPNTPIRIILFPTEPKTGIRLVAKYDNRHPTQDTDFVINLFTFVDQTVVKISLGAEGEDW